MGRRNQVAQVGMVGLGLMGKAMSTRLLAAGFPVVGYDPAPEARRAHKARGGALADSPAQVARQCAAVILSLPSGDISHSVCLGRDGLVEGAHERTVVLETSTVLPEQAERLGTELGAAGARFCDVAISANSDMVARGQALAMVGGDAESLQRVTPVLSAFCKEVRHLGRHGDGMRAKLVVNLVLALNRYALAEGLLLAQGMDLDLGKTLGVLRASAASSTAMDMWGQRMVDRRYSEPASRIRMHDKDAQLMLELGRRHHVPLFGMTQLNALVQVALAHGWGDADNAVIVEVLRDLAGLPTPEDLGGSAG
jgi:3-hydroxyisobutyrate dehydrogenase-like beta-hydroxyacid dehydrogenase